VQWELFEKQVKDDPSAQYCVITTPGGGEGGPERALANTAGDVARSNITILSTIL
jgi:hypothetical protein